MRVTTWSNPSSWRNWPRQSIAVWQKRDEVGSILLKARCDGVASAAGRSKARVGATSIERPGNGQDEEQGAADVASSASQADRPPNDVMRSWLARGIHTVGIDPRRLGGRGDARRVLGEDRRSAVPAPGA